MKTDDTADGQLELKSRRSQWRGIPPTWVCERPDLADFKLAMSGLLFMKNIGFALLSSALLLSPLAATGAFAQTTQSTTQSGSQTPATAGSGSVATSVKPAGSAIGADSTASVPSSTTTQGNYPAGAQPGAGTGMGKVSGTPAGN